MSHNSVSPFPTISLSSRSQRLVCCLVHSTAYSTQQLFDMQMSVPSLTERNFIQDALSLTCQSISHWRSTGKTRKFSRNFISEKSMDQYCGIHGILQSFCVHKNTSILLDKLFLSAVLSIYCRRWSEEDRIKDDFDHSQYSGEDDYATRGPYQSPIYSSLNGADTYNSKMGLFEIRSSS